MIRDKGFTLMEIIVVAAIFMFVVTISTSIILNITREQTRVKNIQAVHSDLRYVLEKIAQDVRTGGIDFSYYRDPVNFADGNKYVPWIDDSTQRILLDRSGGKNQSAIDRIQVLSLRDSQYNQIFYVFDKDRGKIQTCVNVYGGKDYEAIIDIDRCDDRDKWKDITPHHVSVTNIEFIFTPPNDPFFQPIGETLRGLEGGPETCKKVENWNNQIGRCSCANETECWSSESCENDYCQNPDQQPMITIVIQGRADKSLPQSVGDEIISLQTTVISRVYQR